MREKKTPNKKGKSTRSSKKDYPVRSGRHELMYEDDRLYYDEVPYDEREGYYYDEQGYYDDYGEMTVVERGRYPQRAERDNIVEYQGYYDPDYDDEPPVYDRTAKRAAAKRERRRKTKITLIIIATLLILLAIGVTVAAFFVTHMPNILPNVYVDGVAVGEMTRTQAREAIVQSGWEENSQMLEVSLLERSSFEVDPCLAGARLTVDEAVEAAYAHGHERNWYKNLLSYVDCFFRPVDVNEKSLVQKRDYVLAQVQQGIEELNIVLGDGAYTVDEENSALLLTKGAGQLEMDSESIADAIYAAFGAGQSTLYYDTVLKAPTMPDFQAIFEKLSAEPINASYSDDNRFTVLPHQVGCDFDMEDAKDIWNNAANGAVVHIPLDITYPDVTAERLTSQLYRDLLGASTTYYPNSNDNRISNLNLAASKINGLILYPGEEFSYNATLGQRTEEAGFLPAGAYENGEVVEEVGGGICQVSSTLYSAMLYGYKLTTVERYPHYFPVDYLEKGFDATVSWPKPDFKFRNDRDFPIKITATCNNDERSLTVQIWGTNLDGVYMHLTKDTYSYNSAKYPWIMEGYGVQVFRHVMDANGMPVGRVDEVYDVYHTHEATEQIKALDAQAAAQAAAMG